CGLRWKLRSPHGGCEESIRVLWVERAAATRNKLAAYSPLFERDNGLQPRRDAAHAGSSRLARCAWVARNCSYLKERSALEPANQGDQETDQDGCNRDYHQGAEPHGPVVRALRQGAARRDEGPEKSGERDASHVAPRCTGMGQSHSWGLQP